MYRDPYYYYLHQNQAICRTCLAASGIDESICVKCTEPTSLNVITKFEDCFDKILFFENLKDIQCRVCKVNMQQIIRSEISFHMYRSPDGVDLCHPCHNAMLVGDNLTFSDRTFEEVTDPHTQMDGLSWFWALNSYFCDACKETFYILFVTKSVPA